MSDSEQIGEVPSDGTAKEGNGEAPEHKKVAVIFAHPDDPDFSCAGTVARWTDEGHEVVYVLLTNGDKGSHDPEMSPERLVKIREKEQRAAAAVVGVKEVIFLGRPDGLLVADLELRRDVVRVIRQLKPTTVVCGDPTVYWHAPWYINHPDHRAAGEVVLAALYPAVGNRNYFPELLAEGLEPHKVKELYISGSPNADTFVDIGPYLDRKIAALKAHASQMGDWDPSEPIREWASKDGQRANPPVEFAEDYLYFTPEG
ncbi:MAG TPA: PIG-L deacetylase family protein [Thermomicrobiales bacterium]|jgi:LmbE family N-acetylglucosaminyl deacetylase